MLYKNTAFILDNEKNAHLNNQVRNSAILNLVILLAKILKF